MERSSSHPPLPETGRKGYEVDPVAGMAHPAIGKISMRAAVEWFKEEKLHEYTLMLHTHADAQRRRLHRVGKARQNKPKFERSDFYRFGHVTLGYHLSTVLYCCPRSDLVDSRGNTTSQPRGPNGFGVPSVGTALSTERSMKSVFRYGPCAKPFAICSGPKAQVF